VADTLAVFLIGAPGAGKTSLLESLSQLLELEGVSHGALESEQLSFGWPLLGARAWIPQLEGVLRLQREAGRSTFLISATPEREAELEELVVAARADATLVVCLRVAPAVAAARVAAREPESWPGRARLIERAGELAERVEHFSGIDLALDSETSSPAEMAAEILRDMRRLCQL
jgi:cytidylate kinase